MIQLKIILHYMFDKVTGTKFLRSSQVQMRIHIFSYIPELITVLKMLTWTLPPLQQILYIYISNMPVIFLNDNVA